MTSLSVGITTAAIGAWCYCWALLGRTQTSVTFTGWTQLLSADVGTSCRYGLWRRRKISGDTAFTLSWPAAEGASAVWVSYLGLDPAVPNESPAELDHLVSAAAFATPNLTPAASGRWALAFFSNRGSSLGSPVNAFTTDAALVDRRDAQNTATSHFMLVQAADSHNAVSTAAHSYTDTLNHSSANGAGGLLFLIPAPAGIAGRLTFERQAISRSATF